MSAPSPSTWADRQHAFHEAYNADSEHLPRREVHWRVIEGSEHWRAHGIVGVAAMLAWLGSRLVQRRAFNEEPLLAIWASDAPTGSDAMLVFEAEPLPNDREGDGVAVGELGQNGAVCIETANAIVWPTYNPRVPITRAPRR